MADSVSIFAEGTAEEQLQELVEYLFRSQPEDSRDAFKQSFTELVTTHGGQKPLSEDAERRKKALLQIVNEVHGLGEGTNKEIEGFFNLLFSRLLDVYSADSKEFLDSVTKTLIALKEPPADAAFVTYRVFANLFNIVPRTSPARLLVCQALLKLAAENDEVDTLQFSSADIDRWLCEWDATPDEKSDFLQTVADTYAAVGKLETAYTYSIAYVRSLSPTSASTKAAVLQLIATSLRLPTVFDFSPLRELKNVQSLGQHALYELLQIFSEKGISEYKAWQANNAATLNEFNLEVPQLERKLQLLVLSELCFSKVGQQVPYSDIQSALRIDSKNVEKWAIDAIRAGLISGKLSQTTQTLLVVRASPRSFGIEQWGILEQRLHAWRTGLTGVQSILASARQTSGGSIDKGAHAIEQHA